jgi:hypothetical protein
MKIDGPHQTQKTGSAKKAGKSASGTDTGFSDLLGVDDAKETTHAAGANVIARVDVLLAAQGSEDPAEKASRGRMRKRGSEILHQLDKIRLGMLTGSLTVGNLVDIADVVAAHRERINDPQLAGILDEIDLRAQIEIAKMKLALDKANPS